MKKPPIPLLKPEVDKILNYAKKDNEFYYLFLRTLRKSGRRTGELYGVLFQEKRCTKCRKILKVRKTTKVCPICKKKLGKEYKKETLRRVQGGWFEWRYGLQVKDIDFSDNTFQTYVLKRSSYRKILAFLDPGTMKLLKKFIKKHKLKDDDYPFRAKSYRQIQRMPGKYARILKIDKNVSLHSLRHFFITFCREKGMVYEDIKKITGHADIRTLQTYDHSDVRTIEPTARKIVEEV